MKTKRLAGLLVATVLLLAGPGLMAQAPKPSPPASGQGDQASVEKDIQLLRTDLRSDKKQLIAANLSLTDSEATKFWPVYDQYQAEYSKIGDAKVALIKDYAANWGTISDDQALALLKRSQDIDESVIQLRKKYVPIINKVLPGKKTATFFQLDRRIDDLVNVQLASQIPLVQSQ
jgi:hypothetical protein